MKILTFPYLSVSVIFCDESIIYIYNIYCTYIYRKMYKTYFKVSYIVKISKHLSDRWALHLHSIFLQWTLQQTVQRSTHRAQKVQSTLSRYSLPNYAASVNVICFGNESIQSTSHKNVKKKMLTETSCALKLKKTWIFCINAMTLSDAQLR